LKIRFDRQDTKEKEMGPWIIRGASIGNGPDMRPGSPVPPYLRDSSVVLASLGTSSWDLTL
jgi:hypothetical protein